MSTVWQATNKTGKNLGEDIKKLLDAASAVDWLGPKEAPVLLKPNLVVSKPASGGATTHPEIVAGIMEYLLDSGYRNITIAEGSWVGDSTEKAFRVCGYTKLAGKYGAGLVDLQNDPSVSVLVDGDSFKICKTIAELERNGGSLVNLPVLKGHGQTGLTCALKNMKGCIPNSEKRRYHSLGIHHPVAVLNTIIKPAFALVDGLNGDPYWEEGGSPEKRDLLLLGKDPVSIDAYACSLIGIELQDVEYISIAENLGVGTTEIKDTDVIHLDGDNQLPAAAFHEDSSADSEKIRYRINSIVDQSAACSACFGNLAAALREIHKTDGTFLDTIPEKGICIGQDFRGKKLPEGKTGIGVCTKGDAGNRNLAGCPPSKAAIQNFLIDL